MQLILWKTIYRCFILPLILVVANITALFSKKIRKGLYPRFHSLKNYKAETQDFTSTKPCVLVHAASLGEFEHIRPLLVRLKNAFNSTNIVSFFSPSGYENVRKTSGLDNYLYMPVDRQSNWRKVYEYIKPDIIIISKHDVWPEMIWQAKKQNIPVFLVNASLAENSSRTKTMVRSFLKTVYNPVDGIYAISGEDAERFRKYFPGCSVENVGDTKYDQVLFRKEAAAEQVAYLKNWANRHIVFVAGSIWPEDQKHLFPALKILLGKYPSLKLILVPHEPTEKTIQHIRNELSDWSVCLYSHKSKLENHRIFLVDAIGHLAALYHVADIAYVGGSFYQGIHNAMEPAIYGIPVLYGPEHKNSYDAIQLNNGHGGIVVHNNIELENQLMQLINEPAYCKKLGVAAAAFARKNTGATQILIEKWRPLLEARQ